MLINQSGKGATSKPRAYIESPTQTIYCFITLAVLLQTFHLKGSESCSAFKFLLEGRGFCVFKSAKALPSTTGKEKEVAIYS